MPDYFTPALKHISESDVSDNHSTYAFLISCKEGTIRSRQRELRLKRSYLYKQAKKIGKHIFFPYPE